MTTKKRYLVHPYKSGSASAKALANALGGKRLLINGKSKYKHREGDVVINWGSSTKYIEAPMLNEPQRVSVASNKLTFFEALENSAARLVPFTRDVSEVEQWLLKGSTVCARTKLTGHSAEGLIILTPDEKELDIPEAKLYTKYVPKSKEYRVHVVGGKAIRIQKKILRPEITQDIRDKKVDPASIDWKVRNHDNGFIYVTDGVEEECPEDVSEQALQAVQAVGLFFGAVDVIWNDTKKTAFVLEINTSPGLEGSTIDAYVEAFQSADTDPSSLPSSNPYARIAEHVKLRGKETSSGPLYTYRYVKNAVKAAEGRPHFDFCLWANCESFLISQDLPLITRYDFEDAKRLHGPGVERVQQFAQALCDGLGLKYQSITTPKT